MLPHGRLNLEIEKYVDDNDVAEASMLSSKEDAEKSSRMDESSKKSGQRRNTHDNVDNPIADRNNRLSRLIEHLKNSAKDENESDIFIKLLSLEKEKVPNLERPFFTCKPATLISQLYQYIAFETSLQTEEIELFVVKECNPNIIFGDANLDPSNIKFEFLTREEESSFAEIIPNNLIRGYLVIAYKKKVWDLNVALC